jgi:NADPH:quinone reductase-like Zn-dependent oxidoreductase
MQYALHKYCEVIATTSSVSKKDFLKAQCATHVINISEENFFQSVRPLAPQGVDIIFDALGGKYFKQGIRLLDVGGRMICYGASQMTSTNLLNRIKAALQFGIYHPAEFMMPSKSLIGVNMLRIADKKPEVLQYCLQQVMHLHNVGVFKPAAGKIFPASQIAEAHRYLENRKAIGKVALAWI